VLAEDDRFVLEPEVEQVAVDEERGGVLGRVVQEAAEGALRLSRNGAQVDVGDDVGGLALHGGPSYPARGAPTSRAV
jgi:hypothetical protein